MTWVIGEEVVQRQLWLRQEKQYIPANPYRKCSLIPISAFHNRRCSSHVGAWAIHDLVRVAMAGAVGVRMRVVVYMPAVVGVRMGHVVSGAEEAEDMDSRMVVLL
jgi:hypothetical protein